MHFRPTTCFNFSQLQLQHNLDLHIPDDTMLGNDTFLATEVKYAYQVAASGPAESPFAPSFHNNGTKGSQLDM